MQKYYYLASALPNIDLKALPEINFEELVFMLQVNLTKKDWSAFVEFRKYIDLNNLRLLWMNREIDPRGNLNEAQLEDVLLIKNFFSDYVFEFLEKYESTKNKLRYFSFLISSFFYDIMNRGCEFLKFYFNFERELTLILTALRAWRLKRDIARELQFENMEDDLVAFILAQKDMDHFEPPKRYEKIKNTYIKYASDPKNLHLAILNFRFNEISKFSEKKPFTINQVLSYVAQCIIIEDLHKLSFQEGKEKILKEKNE